jgi:cobalt-zinc-cadmium efflux system membrane fusion protein
MITYSKTTATTATTAGRTMARAGALLLALAAACSKSSSPESSVSFGADTTIKANAFTVTADQRAKIHLDTLRVTSYRPDVDATGTVAFNGDKSTQVLSPVSGPAVHVVGDVGMHVIKGQPLAYVSSPDFASAVADYRKAETAERNTRRIAERDSALFANDALARAALEQAQADAASADADLDAAVQTMRSLGVEQSQIDAVREGRATSIEAIIRSPIDGTVVEKLIAEGQLLAAGSTPTFTVADLSTVWVMANVYANQLSGVSVGESADVLTSASARPIEGKVDYIASLADPGTNAVSVRLLVPNERQLLRRDMFVSVAIHSSSSRQGILIPVSALQRDEDNLPFVFVVAGPGSYLRRRIDLGGRVGDRYEATSGLNAGDVVVTDGALFLQFAETQ